MADEGIYRRGRVWWVRYSRHGKQHFESSKSKKKSVAQKLLALRQGQVVEGKWPGLHVERITFDELKDDFENDYKVNGKRSFSRAKGALKHLDEFFKGMRAQEITTDKVKEYLTLRMEQTNKRKKKPANATLNRELAALKRMFSLGAKSSPPKVLHVPYIPKLEENNVRKGFFTLKEYQALKEKLPAHLKPLLTAGFWTGMRLGELLQLKWEQVDLKEGCIRLEPDSTKNRKGRTVYMPKDMARELKQQKADRDAQHPDCGLVFHHNGAPIKDFRRSWQTTCEEAKLKGRLFHDLRRTGVRNLIRAGVPEKVAMEVSGHLTRSVFDRYNIVSTEDLKAAAKSLDTFFARN